jgi:SAM-dependent methyltransferase
VNPDLSADHPSIRYYDGDYPSTHASTVPENCDATLEFQGLAHDLDRYLELARESGDPILDLCCGTGRVTIPLARAGFHCIAVDVNAGMLERCAANLAREPAPVRDRVTLERGDVEHLDLPARRFCLAICAFNSLLCIPSFDAQRRALRAVAAHLAPGGRLALDVVNPLRLTLDGDPVPKPFFTRRQPASGRTYTRFAASGPLDAEQRQRLHGWYDELAEDGTVRRTLYSLLWRPIFRFELELMLREAGFEIENIEGGHRRELFEASSPRMFVTARRSTSDGPRAERSPAGVQHDGDLV